MHNSSLGFLNFTRECTVAWVIVVHFRRPDAFKRNKYALHSIHLSRRKKKRVLKSARNARQRFARVKKRKEVRVLVKLKTKKT